VVRGLDLEGGDLRIGFTAIGHALADPADEGLVALGTRIELFPAAVGDDVRRLEQQQALVRRGREDTAAAAFLDDVLVVLLGLEAKQG
jgi:hypothetical protein